MTRIVGALLGCLLACVVAAAASHWPYIPPPSDDHRQLIRGRLIGVEFASRPPEDSVVLTLGFLVEDPIATYDVRAPGTYIDRVTTNIKLEPSTLTSANYHEKIEAAIGHSVRLGDSCLILSRSPSSSAKELLSIEPASPEAEARLRAENKDLLLYFRRLRSRNQFANVTNELAEQHSPITQPLHQLESEPRAPAERRAVLLTSLREGVDKFLAVYARQKEAIASRIRELKVAADATSDDEERRSLELMINDLLEIDAKIDEQRASLAYRLQAAGLGSVMPE